MDLFSLLGGLLNQKRPSQNQTQYTPQPLSQSSINSAPFRMYEDGTFQGNPRDFQAMHPNFNFYEDNSFNANRDPYRVNPQDSVRRLKI